MIHPSRIVLARLWLADHTTVVILTFVVVVFSVGNAAANFPLGPRVQVVGSVVSVAYLRGRYGSHYQLNAEADGRLIPLSPFVAGACTVGSPIKLERQRRIWGYAYADDEPACAG